MVSLSDCGTLQLTQFILTPMLHESKKAVAGKTPAKVGIKSCRHATEWFILYMHLAQRWTHTHMHTNTHAHKHTHTDICTETILRN